MAEVALGLGAGSVGELGGEVLGADTVDGCGVRNIGLPKAKIECCACRTEGEIGVGNSSVAGFNRPEGLGERTDSGTETVKTTPLKRFMEQGEHTRPHNSRKHWLTRG